MPAFPVVWLYMLPVRNCCPSEKDKPHSSEFWEPFIKMVSWKAAMTSSSCLSGVIRDEPGLKTRLVWLIVVLHL